MDAERLSLQDLLTAIFATTERRGAVLVCLFLLQILLSDPMKINLNAIAKIESGGNAKAFNWKTKATGIYQITPICLKDWNQEHPESPYMLADLWNARINEQIADWYLHVRLPQILDTLDVPVTEETLLYAFNWGPGNVRKAYRPQIGERVPKIPIETRNYVANYRRIVAGL